jgi:N-methylhydantoinase A
MTRALRVISIERGLDPRELTLVAFGGAGGLHACALAEELRIPRVLVPRAAGVLSALGLAISDVRRDHVHPFLAALEHADPAEVEAAFAALERQAAGQLGGEERRTVTRSADARYQGQSFELTVGAEDLAGLAGRFHAEHQRRYGYRMDDEPVELVNLRLVATVPGDKPALHQAAAPGEVPRGRRRASFDGDWREVDVVQRDDLGAGSGVQGPAVVEFPESTLLLRPGWRGTVDQAGALVLERAP